MPDSQRLGADKEECRDTGKGQRAKANHSGHVDRAGPLIRRFAEI